MSNDPRPKRIRQEGECVRCGKLVWRGSPEQRWTDQYGRDRCRASWDDDQCDVREWTTETLEPPACAHAGAVRVDSLSGEHVAWLCLACGQQLDVGWQPPEPLQFMVELTVNSAPDAEIPLGAPPGVQVECYPVTETTSLIMARGTLN